MKKLATIFGLTGVLALGAMAQDPGMAPDPGMPASDPAMQSGVTVTTETTTGYADDTMIIGADDPGTMPATGGAPIAMALVGTLAAAGAFFARRKLS